MTSKIKTFEINGIIDTAEPVLGNLQKLCAAAACYFTFDSTQGKYSVVENKQDVPIATFDDSNILGGIQLGTLDVDEMYNAMSIEFNSKDLRNETDVVHYKLTDGNMYGKEFYNPLNLRFDLVNNPVQAAYLGRIQVQQTRFDKLIQFRTDYSYSGLRAGDVIQVVNDVLGYPLTGNVTTLGYFRIASIKEVDSAEDGFVIEITGHQYADRVYTQNLMSRDFDREERDKKTGIKASRTSACIAAKDDTKIGEDASKVYESGSAANTAAKSKAQETGFIPELAKRTFTIAGPQNICEGDTGVTYTFTAPADCCGRDDYTVPYTISGTGIETLDISIPLTGDLTFTSGVATMVFDVDNSADTEGNETMTIAVGCNRYDVVIHDNYVDVPAYTITADTTTDTDVNEADECDTLTFNITATNTDNGAGIDYTVTGIDSADLLTGSLTGTVVADWCDTAGTVAFTFTKGSTESDTIVFTLDGKGVSKSVVLNDAADYTVAWGHTEITEGDTTSATVTVDGIPDGTSVPWALSGTASGKVTSATSGTVTISSGQGIVTGISTNDDGVEDGYSTTLIITFGPTTGYETCGNASASLTVLDNDGGSPEFSNCQYTLVPGVWCAAYASANGQVSNITPKDYVSVMTYPRVGTPVQIPTAVTVTAGLPSTVTINATVTAYTGTGMGGIPFEIITTFDSLGADQPVTGTTTQVRGYT
jgi:hypothetical protein